MASRPAFALALVALLAVGLLGGLTWARTQSEVSSLVRSRDAATSQNVAAALADAYATGGGSWQSADLRAAHVLAVIAGASLEVHDAAGRPVTGFGLGF